LVSPLPKLCPQDGCEVSDHRCDWVRPAAPPLFAHVVGIIAQLPDPKDAARLAREAALKLGFDATHFWIEAQCLAARRRQ
jgi:hypothetical protein